MASRDLIKNKKFYYKFYEIIIRIDMQIKM